MLVQATPDRAADMKISHRRDSFCGKMSACNNMMQYGIPYSLTAQHTVQPDSDEFRKDLAWENSEKHLIATYQSLLDRPAHAKTLASSADSGTVL